MAHHDQAPARLVICAPAKLPAIFGNDLKGTCALCRQSVRFRPHVPAPRVLVCLECYLVHAEPGAKCELLPAAALELEQMGFDPPRWGD
jgi:hypothetical protein